MRLLEALVLEGGKEEAEWQRQVVQVLQREQARADEYSLAEDWAALPARAVAPLFAVLKAGVQGVAQRQMHLPLAEREGEQGEREGEEGEEEHVFALRFLHAVATIVHVALQNMDKREPTESMLDCAAELHDVMLELQGPAGAVLQTLIARICETWWTREYPGAEVLVPQLIPFLLITALEPEAKDADVKRVHAVRESLMLLDFDDESIESVRHLLLRCFVHPPFLRCPEGRRFMAFLFQLHGSLTEDLYRALRVQIPNVRQGVLKTFAEVLFRAWKLAEDDETRETLEEICIQDLMHSAMHASTPALFHRVRTLLNAFHEQKRQKDVEAALLRLYGPILWRSINAANPLVRMQAATLFFDVFPLQDPSSGRVEADELLQRQFDTLDQLLQDEDHRVRAAAISGACHVLSVFWEVVPTATTKQIVTYIVGTLAKDASCSTVRLAVVHGLHELLRDNPLAHPVLKAVLASTAHLLHDRSEKVRSAFVALLDTVRVTRDMHVYDIASADSLLARLQDDAGSKTVASAITKLLLPSYYPQDEEVANSEKVARCMALADQNMPAALAFFSHMKTHASVESASKLCVLFWRCMVHSSARRGIQLTNVSAAIRTKLLQLIETLLRSIATDLRRPIHGNALDLLRQHFAFDALEMVLVACQNERLGAACALVLSIWSFLAYAIAGASSGGRALEGGAEAEEEADDEDKQREDEQDLAAHPLPLEAVLQLTVRVVSGGGGVAAAAVAGQKSTENDVALLPTTTHEGVCFGVFHEILVHNGIVVAAGSDAAQAEAEADAEAVADEEDTDTPGTPSTAEAVDAMWRLCASWRQGADVLRLVCDEIKSCLGCLARNADPADRHGSAVARSTEGDRGTEADRSTNAKPQPAKRGKRGRPRSAAGQAREEEQEGQGHTDSKDAGSMAAATERGGGVLSFADSVMVLRGLLLSTSPSVQAERQHLLADDGLFQMLWRSLGMATIAIESRMWKGGEDASSVATLYEPLLLACTDMMLVAQLHRAAILQTERTAERDVAAGADPHSDRGSPVNGALSTPSGPAEARRAAAAAAAAADPNSLPIPEGMVGYLAWLGDEPLACLTMGVRTSVGISGQPAAADQHQDGLRRLVPSPSPLAPARSRARRGGRRSGASSSSSVDAGSSGSAAEDRTVQVADVRARVFSARLMQRALLLLSDLVACDMCVSDIAQQVDTWAETIQTALVQPVDEGWSSGGVDTSLLLRIVPGVCKMVYTMAKRQSVLRPSGAMFQLFLAVTAADSLEQQAKAGMTLAQAEILDEDEEDEERIARSLVGDVVVHKSLSTSKTLSSLLSLKVASRSWPRAGAAKQARVSVGDELGRRHGLQASWAGPFFDACLAFVLDGMDPRHCLREDADGDLFVGLAGEQYPRDVAALQFMHPSAGPVLEALLRSQKCRAALSQVMVSAITSRPPSLADVAEESEDDENAPTAAQSKLFIFEALAALSVSVAPATAGARKSGAASRKWMEREFQQQLAKLKSAHGRAAPLQPLEERSAGVNNIAPDGEENRDGLQDRDVDEASASGVATNKDPGMEAPSHLTTFLQALTVSVAPPSTDS